MNVVIQGGIVMCKAECEKCGQVFDVSDLMHREMMFRYRTRIQTGADYSPDLSMIYMAHPIIKGCHKGCSGEMDGEWVQYKRCKLPGCCLPMVEACHG